MTVSPPGVARIVAVQRRPPAGSDDKESLKP